MTSPLDTYKLIASSPAFRFVRWAVDRLALWGCATIIVLGLIAAMFIREWLK